MGDNTIRRVILRPAKPGSKKGWVKRTVDFPPELDTRLTAHIEQQPAFRGDVIVVALEQYLNREAA